MMSDGKKTAKIESARVASVWDLWVRKPRGLGFEDTDAVIVTAKTADGVISVRETFYVCVKADGTFSMKSLSHRSDARRRRFCRFLKRYILPKDADARHYNLGAEIGKWKGREVTLVPNQAGGYVMEL